MNANHAYYDIVIEGYPCILLLISADMFVISNLKRDKSACISEKNYWGMFEELYGYLLYSGTILNPFFITLKFYDSLVASVIFALVIWMVSLLISMLLYRISLAKKIVTF